MTAPVLTELRLENYAVIDHQVVEFASGLNLLTGETGAGKSILIDALALLLGEKASGQIVRSGAQKAVIAAVFETGGEAAREVSKILESNGLDSDGDQLILRREVAVEGKGRVFVNNQPATVAVLKQIAPHLASIHAQSESLVSFDSASRLNLLDAFAGVEAEGMASAFDAWKSIHRRMVELESNEADRVRLLDLWRFQKKEIDEARLESGEDEKLATEKLVLANAEKIHNSAMAAFDRLYEGEASASAGLRAAQKQLEELTRFEARFQEAAAALESARISIEDVGATLRDYAGGVQSSPERLAAVEDRLVAIERLKRKYGGSVEEIFKFAADVNRKIEEVDNKDEILAGLRRELNEAEGRFWATATAISKKRRDAAKKLESVVDGQIRDLAMRSKFEVKIESGKRGSAGDWSREGIDRVEYLIATNPGEPMRPLEEIASGGELSRVMLALKASVESGTKRRKAEEQRTLVFDEIDIGIGGRAAEAVGRKLKSLSRSDQILCVTHLPQIAAFADHHFLIEKKVHGKRTGTTLREICGEERTEEIARMLSGEKLTDTSRKHAEQMLKTNA